jgi:predicted ferric reductase
LLTRPAVLMTDAGRSGLVLLVVFVAMWATALSVVRKRGHFRLFFLVHFGYVAWVALAIVHGPRFWQWLTVPFLGFAAERLWRLKRSSAAVRIISGELLPSDVLALTLEKPKDFSHHAGGYLFFKCPEVSAFEWHPFTISSAPEEEHLTVHIRAVGSWTGALYKLVKARPKDVTALVDGPYGAPAQAIFECKRAVLIGAGIGVTPFASVLRSILLRKQRGDSTLGLDKVRFYWLSREQRSFEWFLQLLSEIERDASGLFELNVYLTGAESRHDLKAATLFIAMDMLHEKTKVDLITGLHSQTHTGRPDWPAIFDQIVKEDGDHPSTVFFCGPPGLGRELKTACTRRGLGFRQEVF